MSSDAEKYIKDNLSNNIVLDIYIYKVAETKRGGEMGDEMGVDQCRDQCRDRNMK